MPMSIYVYLATPAYRINSYSQKVFQLEGDSNETIVFYL
jgi:hypothetical protein